MAEQEDFWAEDLPSAVYIVRKGNRAQRARTAEGARAQVDAAEALEAASDSALARDVQRVCEKALIDQLLGPVGPLGR